MGKASRRRLQSSSTRNEQRCIYESILRILPPPFQGRLIDHTQGFISKNSCPWANDKMNLYLVHNHPSTRMLFDIIKRPTASFIVFHFDEYVADLEVEEEWSKIKLKTWLERDLEKKTICSICVETISDQTLNSCPRCESQWCDACHQLAFNQKQDGQEVACISRCLICHHKLP